MIKKRIIFSICFYLIFFLVNNNLFAIYNFNEKIKTKIEKIANNYIIKITSETNNNREKLNKLISTIKIINSLIIKIKAEKKYETKREKYLAILTYFRNFFENNISVMNISFKENEKQELKLLGIKLKKRNVFESKIKVYVTENLKSIVKYPNPKPEKKQIILGKEYIVYSLYLDKNKNLLVKKIFLRNKKVEREIVLRKFLKNTYKIIDFKEKGPKICYNSKELYKNTLFEGLDESYIFTADNLRNLAHNMEDITLWKIPKNNTGDLCKKGNYWRFVKVGEGLDMIIINMSKE